MKKIHILTILFPLVSQSIFAQWYPSEGMISQTGQIIPPYPNNLMFSNGILTVSTEGDGLFNSTDNGLHWTHNNDINDFLVGARGFVQLANGNWLVGTTSGIYETVNNGINWIYKGSLENTFADNFSVLGSDIFAVSAPGSGIFHYNSENNTWGKIAFPHAFGLGVSTSFGNKLFVTVSDPDQWNKTYLYWSDNKGNSWHKSEDQLLLGRITSLLSNPDYLYAAKDSVILRTENGLEWNSLSTISQTNVIFSLYKKENILYAGDYGHGIFRSDNGGYNWVSLNEGLPSKVIADIIQTENNLIVATFPDIDRPSSVYYRDVTDLTVIEENKNNQFPESIRIKSISPNPFNPSTKISISSIISGYGKVEIFNLSGQKIKTLFEGIIEKGEREFWFEANENPSGIYFCRIQTKNKTATQKMILMK